MPFTIDPNDPEKYVSDPNGQFDIDPKDPDNFIRIQSAPKAISESDTKAPGFLQSLFPYTANTPEVPKKKLDPTLPDFIDTPGGKMFNFKKYDLDPNVERKTASVASDVSSLPGRVLASLPEIASVGNGVSDPDTYYSNVGKSIAKTKSDKTGVPGALANVLRSPQMGAMVATGGLGILPAAIAGATAGQAQNVAEGKKADPGQFAADAAINTVVPYGANKVGQFAQSLLRYPANVVKSFFIKNLGFNAKAAMEGVTPETIAKYMTPEGVGPDVNTGMLPDIPKDLTLPDVAKNVSAQKKTVGVGLQMFFKQADEAGIMADPTEPLKALKSARQTLMEQTGAGTITKPTADAIMKELEDASQLLKGPEGFSKVPVSKLWKFRQDIDDLADFGKTPGEESVRSEIAKKARALIDNEIKSNIGFKLGNSALGELEAMNKTYSELLPINSMLQKQLPKSAATEATKFSKLPSVESLKHGLLEPAIKGIAPVTSAIADASAVVPSTNVGQFGSRMTKDFLLQKMFENRNKQSNSQ